MVNIQTVLNLALMVVIIIMSAIIVMQNAQTCPVVEHPVCPTVTPIVCDTTIHTVYIENKTSCDKVTPVAYTSPEEIAKLLGVTQTVPDSTYDGKIPDFTSVTMTPSYNSNYMMNAIPTVV
jgi:hypothetical protein